MFDENGMNNLARNNNFQLEIFSSFSCQQHLFIQCRKVPLLPKAYSYLLLTRQHCHDED